RCKVDEFREIGRNTQGVRILDLDGEGDRVVAVARVAEAGEVLPEEGSAEKVARRYSLCYARTGCFFNDPFRTSAEEAAGYGRQAGPRGAYRILRPDLGRDVSEPSRSFDPSF
ncbi:MAG: hypothetical protein K8R65_06165, partial [Nitrospirae bacterium]|nr:hypothetical protein [Nitrospirota bacterium]